MTRLQLKNILRKNIRSRINYDKLGLWLEVWERQTLLLLLAGAVIGLLMVGK